MSMKKITIFFCLSIILITPAIADLIVYPSEGQSEDQMAKDKFECQRWATDQTGFDPLATPRASTAPPAAEAPAGGLGRGALRGAAAGAVAGAITGSAGSGARTGAGTGALLGGMRRSDQLASEQAAVDNWEQQEVARITQERAEFNRAYSACLQGRGYTVM
jgi:hypothetical protein